MTIDDEIQQRQWESFRQKAVVNTMFTCRAIETATSAMLKEHDLSMPQYNILRILRGQKGKPASVKLLTERMLDKSSNASRLVDKLLEKNLVVRVTCPNDRRAVEVSLTSEGLALLEKADADNAAWLPHPKVFSEADAEALSDLLDRLREAIRSTHPEFAKNPEQGDIP